MTRKDFIAQVGIGAAALLVPACLGSCKKSSTSTASASTMSVNFTVNVASGPLATNGGYLLQNGVIVARTNAGTFIAVASTCTHQGGTVGYAPNSNSFICPIHGAQFDANGNVIGGPAPTNLQKFTCTLSGSTLHVTN